MEVMDALNGVLENLFPPMSFVFAVVVLAAILGGILVVIGEKGRGIGYLLAALVGGAILGVIAGDINKAAGFLSGLGVSLR